MISLATHFMTKTKPKQQAFEKMGSEHYIVPQTLHAEKEPNFTGHVNFKQR